MSSKKSNECTWNGESFVIKTAHAQTSSVGILYHMVGRIKGVLGAFEQESGVYRVIQLPIERCTAVMRPTRSKGASRDRVGIIDRKVFEEDGKFVGLVKVDEPSK